LIRHNPNCTDVCCEGCSEQKRKPMTGAQKERERIIALINGEPESTQAYRQGIEDERERTIKLLRNLRCNKMHNCGKWNNHRSYKLHELIELINGETP